MNESLQGHFYNMFETIIGYLPSLFAGLLLIVVGWVLGWIIKRILVQICVLLRLDRMLLQFQWGKGLGRADVRYTLYNAIGNLGFFVVFLAFLSNALTVLNLTVLSNLLEKGIFFLPRLIAALVMLGIGWLLASVASFAAQKALMREGVPRATLIGRFSKSVLILFFSAMALTELNVAREIVIIGFTTIFVTLGSIAIVAAIRADKLTVSDGSGERSDSDR